MTTITEIQDVLASNDVDRARELCEEFIKQNPTSIEARIILGRIYFAQDQHEKSIDSLLLAIQIDPNNFDAHYTLARVYELKDDFNKALEQYKTALSINHKSSLVNYRIGCIFDNYRYHHKDEDEAKRYYQQAVNGDKPLEDAYCNLALLERNKRSVYILQSGLEKFSTSVKLYELLAGRYFYFMNDPAQCIQVVKEASDKGIKSDELSFMAFEACYHLGDFTGALNYLEQISLPDWELSCLKAISLVENTSYQLAEEMLLKIISNDLNNELKYAAHYILMCAYLRENDQQSAMNVFSEIQLDHKPVDLQIYIGTLGMFSYEKYFLDAVNSISTNQMFQAQAKGIKAFYFYNKLNEQDATINKKQDVEHIDIDALQIDLELAIEQFPENSGFHQALGDILYRQSKWIESAVHLVMAQLYSEKNEYIAIRSLEKIYSSKTRYNQFLKRIDELITASYPYKQRFCKYFMEEIVKFLFSENDFQRVIEFVTRFDKAFWPKEHMLFEVAYSYAATNDTKLAKKYYREYLSEVGENQAVLNNLANICLQDNEYSVAEELYRKAIGLGNDLAQKNLQILMEKIQKAEEIKLSIQRAVLLYGQENIKSRRLIAHIYKQRVADDMILCKPNQIPFSVELKKGEAEKLLQEFITKKYFDVVENSNLPFDGVVLRLNQYLVEQVEEELQEEQNELFVEQLAESLSPKNLDEKYGYNLDLTKRLASLHSQELKKLLDRDLKEAAFSLATQSYKATLVLSGSIVEAVLLDTLLARKESAIKALEKIAIKQNKGITSKDKKIEEWALERLLDVAYEEKLISYNLFYWGNGLRGFRNLVHPGVEQRRELAVTKENAEIAWSVVKKLLQEVS